MASETPDYASMDDAALDALDTGYTDEAPATEVVTETTETEATEEEAAAPDADAETTEEDATDDKRKVPVTEHQKMRQRAQAAEAQAAEARNELARIQQAQQAARETSANQAEYDRLYDNVGVETAENFRQQVAQQAQARQNSQAQQAAANQRLADADAVYRDAFPDYDAQIGKAQELLGADELRRIALTKPNPNKWAYEYGKSIQSPEERAAAIKAEVAKEVKATLSKQQEPPPGKKSIGHLSSTRGSAVDKPFGDMNDKELAEHEAFLRSNW